MLNLTQETGANSQVMSVAYDGFSRSRLWPEDVELLHDLWLQLSVDEATGSKLHHRDAVGLALRGLRRDMDSEVLDLAEDLKKEISH